MFLLSFLPDSFLQFIVHTILILGIVGSILGFVVLNRLLIAIPMLARYYRSIQIVGIILLVLGIYFEGGYTNEMMWRNRVKELEVKVAKAEEESKTANDKLDKSKAAKVKVIREKGIVVKQYIDREVTKYDATCPIPDPVVKAHNAAARNEAIK